jgi:hypothetical protein
MTEPEKQIDWAAANVRFKLRQDVPRSFEPAVDELISHIVGKKIYQQDPRLMKLIIKWKSSKPISDEPDNFLKDPRKVEELKIAFNQSL